MLLRNWLVGILVLCLASVTWAQYRNTQPLGEPSEYLRNGTTFGLKNFRGILDPSRMHMSHSMEFGYATSGGKGMTQGLYMNHMGYELLAPVILHHAPRLPLSAFRPGGMESRVEKWRFCRWRRTGLASDEGHQSACFRLPQCRAVFSLLR